MPHIRPRPHLIALTALTTLATTSCSLLAGSDRAEEITGTPAAAEEPSRISIPDIGVRSRLLRLGLNKDDSVQAPPQEKGMTAGWYTGSAKPGTPGAAVIIGHSGTRDGKAVFHDLGKVNKGTAIDIERGDGKVLRFSVTGTETVDRNAFPKRKVYGSTSDRVLRLVTCAGDPDSEGHPARNLIVYATLQA
ncbi:class F sortase [Streptomyces sp. NPDC001407]|uniref:class F sortase n=1 Tax=unclassified Streptomyces TaxID=2593676 RepID=UPI0033E18AC9